LNIYQNNFTRFIKIFYYILFFIDKDEIVYSYNYYLLRIHDNNVNVDIYCLTVEFKNLTYCIGIQQYPSD